MSTCPVVVSSNVARRSSEKGPWPGITIRNMRDDVSIEKDTFVAQIGLEVTQNDKRWPRVPMLGWRSVSFSNSESKYLQVILEGIKFSEAFLSVI